MLTQERRALLLERLRRDGRIVARTISAELGLSEDTIRRDLRDLAAEGLVKRVHGGALPASPALGDLAVRGTIATSGKAAIGRRAAAMVRPGQTVFIDGGTTALQLARHLPPNLAATIVTHSPAVAVELARLPLLTVELVGGRLFRHSLVATGAAALRAIDSFRPDCCFIGVTGVHAETGLTTGDAEEGQIKRAVMERSGETVVLASAEKLGAASAVVIAPCSAADVIVVEAATDEDRLAPLRAQGCTIVLAPGD